jgi:hypothetical protein
MAEVVTLYIEELKATMRGRYAWLGAAVVFLAIGGLATVGPRIPGSMAMAWSNMD